MRATIADDLRALTSPSQVIDGPAALRAYECDAYGIDRSPPDCVVLPRTTEECAAIVAYCHKKRIPFTPRGAGTGLSGGAMAALGGVVISTKGMTRILDIEPENRLLHAQAGAVNLRLSEAVERFNLHFAPDPSSQSVSTLGGNIAENSGGPHTLKYGVTAQHILGLTLVGFDGEIIRLGGPRPDMPGLDLLSLVVGSEGTLGIVTEAIVRLTPIPQSIETALVSFPTTSHATRTVAALIASGIIPSAVEMMDRRILDAVQAAFGLEIPEGTEAMLLIECDGPKMATLEELASVARICREQGAIAVRIARDEKERKELWTARKKGIGAMGRIAPTLITHDGVIPRSKLPEMLEFVYAAADEAGVMVANIFHAGDGNLHPVLCFDEREPGMTDRVIALGEKIIRKCIDLGGSLTGEHGVGVEKAELMKLMFSPEDMRLQTDIKRIFHQTDLVNPCKVIPDQKGCVEHMRRWRGVAT
jgi:glycolate oxidase